MFSWSEEHETARRMIKRWVNEKLRPQNDALEDGALLPYDLMRDFGRTFGLAELARAALLNVDAPKLRPSEPMAAVGGGDPGLQAIFGIEMSRVSPGFYMSLAASLGLAGGAIIAKGTQRQRERWALPITTLEKIGAWALTEPSAGSDALGGMRTTARPIGDRYALNGEKTFITNAPHADIFVIYAKLDREGDPRPMRERPVHAYLVERGTKGLVPSAPMKKMGMRGSATGSVALTDVEVPASQLLGETEASLGRDSVKIAFQGERTGLAPMALGIIEECLDVTTRYVRDRTAWERPIAEYQLVQEKVARMFVHRQNVENLLFKHLWLAANGRSMGAAEASAAKLYSSRAATEVALEAIQALGGNGYMQEYHVEQLARDAKLLQIGGGTDEIQLITIAREVLRSTT